MAPSRAMLAPGWNPMCFCATYRIVRGKAICTHIRSTTPCSLLRSTVRRQRVTETPSAWISWHCLDAIASLLVKPMEDYKRIVVLLSEEDPTCPRLLGANAPRGERRPRNSRRAVASCRGHLPCQRLRR
eukprot:2202354-Prymnesium_polylepis.2